MEGNVWILLAVAGGVLLLMGLFAFLSQRYSLDGIKAKTVGDGQYGTARWATEKEIKKSINSQVLTVFFAPLITAGIHLAFNFPLINRTITLLGFTNPTLLIGTTVACFLVFAVLYVIVYRITSRSYYTIVTGGRE